MSFLINDKTEITTLAGTDEFLAEQADGTYVKVKASTIRRGSPLSIYTITYGSTVAVDRSNGEHQKITLTGDWTPSAISSMQEGDELVIKMIQDAIGGRTIDFGTLVYWQGGTEPAWSTAADAVDTAVLRKIDGLLYGVSGIAWGIGS